MNEYITRSQAAQVISQATYGKTQKQALEALKQLPAADVIPVAWLEEERKRIDSTGLFATACGLVTERWRRDGKEKAQDTPDGLSEGDGQHRD